LPFQIFKDTPHSSGSIDTIVLTEQGALKRNAPNTKSSVIEK